MKLSTLWPLACAVCLLSGCAVVKDTVRKVKHPAPGDCLVLPKGKYDVNNPDNWYIKLSIKCMIE